ncbi:MAG: methyltransferase RsmF C-terminal domain-like protein [Flavisolibacter sp.]
MKLPDALLQSLEGIEGFHRESFVRSHEEARQVTSIRFNPAKKIAGERKEWVLDGPIPWSKLGYYLKQRPSFTFDPLFHAGCYYVQEASSMFLEQALKQLLDLTLPIKVLDLCGAPGGKSTHIQSLISPESVLVSNEVIRNRSLVLKDNIIKWGSNNVIVTNNDPKAFQKLKNYFDVLVVDAPCSGSGLFRRDEEAIEEWSVHAVTLCAQRQQRVLADALPSLKEGGLLVYSTCSYSKEEDENIADWLKEEWMMQPESLMIDDSWGIVKSISSSGSVGYRFYPDLLRGEGFFLSCFRKLSGEGQQKFRVQAPEKLSASEKKIIEPWLKAEVQFIRNNQGITALPPHLLAECSILNPLLNIQYAGVMVGSVMKDRLVPEHSLALSTIVRDDLPAQELDEETAIRYLQRQDINFNSPLRGWQLVRFEGHNLGWVNVLPNRVNNYYPREMRILKQTRDSSFEK